MSTCPRFEVVAVGDTAWVELSTSDQKQSLRLALALAKSGRWKGSPKGLSPSDLGLRSALRARQLRDSVRGSPGLERPHTGLLSCPVLSLKIHPSAQAQRSHDLSCSPVLGDAQLRGQRHLPLACSTCKPSPCTPGLTVHQLWSLHCWKRAWPPSGPRFQCKQEPSEPSTIWICLPWGRETMSVGPVVGHDFADDAVELLFSWEEEEEEDEEDEEESARGGTVLVVALAVPVAFFSMMRIGAVGALFANRAPALGVAHMSATAATTATTIGTK